MRVYCQGGSATSEHTLIDNQGGEGFLARLCMLDVTINEKEFQLIGVYASNNYRDWEAFLW